jgi:type I restriction enzyme M protein
LKAVEAASTVENADAAANGCNIAVSFYVEWPDASEAVDIKMLNREMAWIVARQTGLCVIVTDLKGNAG